MQISSVVEKSYKYNFGMFDGNKYFENIIYIW